jgi:hypothetical protein
MIHLARWRIALNAMLDVSYQPAARFKLYARAMRAARKAGYLRAFQSPAFDPGKAGVSSPALIRR